MILATPVHPKIVKFELHYIMPLFRECLSASPADYLPAAIATPENSTTGFSAVLIICQIIHNFLRLFYIYIYF